MIQSPHTPPSPPTPSSSHESSDVALLSNNSALTSRKRRALQDPIYFIDHRIYSTNNDNKSIQFRVLGTSQNAYTMDFYKSQRSNRFCWKCACRDFEIRQKPCKHIQFIWYRVLNVNSAHVHTDDGPFFDSVDAVQERILNRPSLPTTPPTPHPVSPPSIVSTTTSPSTSPSTPPSSSIVQQRPYLGQNCPICYETFTNECQVYYCEEKCGNSVHQTCFQTFVRFSKKTACPLCRHTMIPTGLDLDCLQHSVRKRRRYRY